MEKIKALLVIDVQNEYMKKYDESLLFRINQRIEHSVENNELIIYVKNTKKLRNRTVTYEFDEKLKVSSEHILYKDKASAFSNNELHNILVENGVSEVEIIGIDGNSCVSCTAVDAQKAGYKVILSCEYIGVQNPERFEVKKSALLKKGIIIL